MDEICGAGESSIGDQLRKARRGEGGGEEGVWEPTIQGRTPRGGHRPLAASFFGFNSNHFTMMIGAD